MTDHRTEMWDRADRNWEHQRWRDQQITDLKTTFTILLALALCWWIGTGVSVEGAAPPVAHHTTTAEVWLERGDTGQQVTAVQQRLDGYGYAIAVDGWYGPQTEAVVTSWQRSNGLLIDGIVGPETWRSLSPAVRFPSVQVTEPPIPQGVDGDCESWRPLVTKYGMPWDGAEWRMHRESRCSHAFNVSSRTGDKSAGVLQVNFYGSLDRMWRDAGWSWDLVSGDPEAAVAAAGALYRMCGGWGPWTPPYSCSGNVLPSPAEMGYTDYTPSEAHEDFMSRFEGGRR